MMRRLSIKRRAGRDARGQSAVELALVLPLLCLLLVAVCDFARLFYASVGVADAARAGVQYGAQNRATAVNYSGMQQAALDDGAGITGLTAVATSFCQCGTTTMSSCNNPCAGTINNFVQVTVTATFSTILTYPGVPHPAPLKSTAIMEVP
jgi:Flp pilus assembly protein TadG